MLTAVYDTKPYDQEHLRAAAHGDTIRWQFWNFRLTAETAPTATGADAVCVFVNDVVDRPCLRVLAGSGVKRGYVHGATDELGFRVVEGEVTVRDLQATVLHLLGLDPHRLRYPYQGLEQRLIGPAEGPRIASELLG